MYVSKHMSLHVAYTEYVKQKSKTPKFSALPTISSDGKPTTKTCDSIINICKNIDDVCDNSKMYTCQIKETTS